MLLLVILWASLITTDGITSRRAKCLIDCYVKCLNTGLVNASQCNCSTSSRKACSVDMDESIIQDSMTNDVLPVNTEYLDSRRIRIKMNPKRDDAFVYIFEYSTVSTAPDDWIFAGANSSPDVTFKIADACRDYQFRVIVVLKNEDQQHRLVVYRPRAIPVDLPTFAIASEKIKTALPVYNADDDTVVVYVSWENPAGYTDADVYGYEGPAIYPIQCDSPEAELPTPSVELYEGGGRLRISLPSEVLESKCRVWAEVRMLPRCVRLEPFSIQQSLELDCNKLTTLDICRHEVAPQCTDVIDVWGSGNNATIMWSPLAGFGVPLYYHIRYGPAQMQGVPPFATWTIASLHEVKTPGNSTKLELHVDEDVDYGIQICGVYNEHRKKPKFGLIRVIPFICTSCNTLPVESFGRCGECTKIEGPLLLGRRCHPKGGIGCTTAGAMLNATESKDDENQSFNHLTVLPSDIFIDLPPESVTNFDVVTGHSNAPSEQKPVDPLQPPSTTTELGLETSSTEHDANQVLSETTGRNKPTEVTLKDFALSTAVNHDTSKTTSTSSTAPSSTTPVKISATTVTAKIPHVMSISSEEKLQLDLDSCILFNGVICEFGCEDQIKCQCPLSTHFLAENGACLKRSDRHPNFVCFSKADVKAIWSPRIHALQIRSKEIYNEIEKHKPFDRIFLEFGRIKLIYSAQATSSNFVFDEKYEKSNKMVVRTDKILRHGLFLTSPFSFYSNQTINPVAYKYGLRICAFNNSQVKNPFTEDWNQRTERPEHSDNDSNDNFDDVDMLHLSAIQFEPGYVQNAVIDEKKQMSRMAFIIAPSILIVLMLFFLTLIIYLNCSRLKRCYDRRKTRHFRPYVWNGTIPPDVTVYNINAYFTGWIGPVKIPVGKT